MSSFTHQSHRFARRVAGLLVAAFAAAVALGAPGASPALADFGFLPGAAGFNGAITNAEGASDTQAGSHPYQITTSFALNTETNTEGQYVPDGDMKNLTVSLPPGLIGNPQVVPQCPMAEFYATNPENTEENDCPSSTQVGMLGLNIIGFGEEYYVPLDNLVVPPGVPAEFGGSLSEIPIVLTASVRSGSDYGIDISVKNPTQSSVLAASSATFWGVPSEASHDPLRGAICYAGTSAKPEACEDGGKPSGGTPAPFLTMPTSCSGPLTFAAKADSWQEPEKWVTDSFLTHETSGAESPVGVTGCEQLDFSPKLSVQPDTTVADSPSGLNVELSLPQSDITEGRAEAELKNATVTLPQGVSVDPSAANGLTGCPLLSGEEEHPGVAGIDVENGEAPNCAESSKIGKVEIDTPLLSEPLKGGIYVAQQGNNPFHSLLAIYLTAYADGVWIKLAGHVEAEPGTGKLTTTFANNPQLPFTNLKLTFFGGPGGVLATPDACGSYTTTSVLSSWAGGPDASPFESFSIDSGCVSGFAPSFTAGTQSPQAGAYSPLTVSFERSDADQYMSGVTVKLPPGVLAKLAGVQECPEADLAAAAAKTGAQEQASPSCPSGSEVGSVTTGAGPGSSPVFISGKAYLTGPYKGAPYGLAVVVPALAGPYDLGTVVVRQALYVDKTTAQVTAVSDPFPTELQGIPLRLRRVDVTFNRPNFTFNPTSCEPMSIAGTLTSTEGASAAVNSRFQAAGCQALDFKPGFKVYTHKGHTRRNGAYLHVHVTSSSGQANIRSVFVKLPKILPARNETLKKACATAQFAANPSGCPKESVVGYATATTPVLAKPLTGPAIFVSHGGAAFPDLDVVLQGDGVTVDLSGITNIVKGITSSDFASVPDVPVSSFELTLPEMSNAALAAEGNLCFLTKAKRVKETVDGKTVYRKHTVKQRRSLIMPTTITGQNGAQIEQSTKIAVEGCG